MALLRAGVDTSVIALWLGHEETDTTQIYLHADMTIKRTGPRPRPPARHHPRPLPSHPTPCSRSSTTSDRRDTGLCRAHNPGRPLTSSHSAASA